MKVMAWVHHLKVMISEMNLILKRFFSFLNEYVSPYNIGVLYNSQRIRLAKVCSNISELNNINTM